MESRSAYADARGNATPETHSALSTPNRALRRPAPTCHPPAMAPQSRSRHLAHPRRFVRSSARRMSSKMKRTACIAQSVRCFLSSVEASEVSGDVRIGRSPTLNVPVRKRARLQDQRCQRHSRAQIDQELTSLRDCSHERQHSGTANEAGREDARCESDRSTTGARRNSSRSSCGHSSALAPSFSSSSRTSLRRSCRC